MYRVAGGMAPWGSMVPMATHLSDLHEVNLMVGSTLRMPTGTCYFLWGAAAYRRHPDRM